jgi:hypothetical protein
LLNSALSTTVRLAEREPVALGVNVTATMQLAPGVSELGQPFSTKSPGFAPVIPILLMFNVLFSLLGTTYGGDGKSNFALPNLQGTAVLSPGQGPGLSLYNLGQTGGETTVTLLQTQLPSHGHATNCANTDGAQPSPQGNVWGDVGGAT